MRIGITCYPTYGGSGVVATELGIELAARGHDIHFISYAPPIRLNLDNERIHFHEVEVVTYPLFDHPPYTLALATKMLEVFESEALDLLHVHYAIPHSVSALLARSMAAPRRLPFITTLHGTDITLVGSNRSYLPITKFSIEQSDGVTSISRYLLGQTLKEFDIKRPIEVIPNFVNCDLYSRAADKGLAGQWAPNGEPVLMHLSNFRPVKRLTDAVEIFTVVRGKVPAKWAKSHASTPRKNSAPTTSSPCTRPTTGASSPNLEGRLTPPPHVSVTSTFPRVHAARERVCRIGTVWPCKDWL